MTARPARIAFVLSSSATARPPRRKKGGEGAGQSCVTLITTLAFSKAASCPACRETRADGSSRYDPEGATSDLCCRRPHVLKAVRIGTRSGFTVAADLFQLVFRPPIGIPNERGGGNSVSLAATQGIHPVSARERIALRHPVFGPNVHECSHTRTRRRRRARSRVNRARGGQRSKPAWSHEGDHAGPRVQRT